MPKSTKAAGAARERAVRAHYRDQGWIAFKVSDSAICDVVAMRDSDIEDVAGSLAHVLMIEVKGNAGSPFMNFRKPERDALKKAAERAGATPLLVHWPPRGEMRLFYTDEWPA